MRLYEKKKLREDKSEVMIKDDNRKQEDVEGMNRTP